MLAQDILPIYEREAAQWARDRPALGWERLVLQEALAGLAAPRLLDLGCGTGLPVAAWCQAQGATVTGVDGAAAMIELLRANVPGARAICADMRGLALGERFDAILAIDSFFHLSATDQRAMFPTFAAHAAPGARLVLTTGYSAGETWGQVGGSTVYHASLAPDEYRALLAANGFDEMWFRRKDRALGGRSVWLAQAQV